MSNSFWYYLRWKASGISSTAFPFREDHVVGETKLVFPVWEIDNQTFSSIELAKPNDCDPYLDASRLLKIASEHSIQGKRIVLVPFITGSGNFTTKPDFVDNNRPGDVLEAIGGHPSNESELSHRIESVAEAINIVKSSHEIACWKFLLQGDAKIQAKMNDGRLTWRLTSQNADLTRFLRTQLCEELTREKISFQSPESTGLSCYVRES